MKFTSINPFNHESFAETSLLIDHDIDLKISLAENSQKKWKLIKLSDRIKALTKLSSLLENQLEVLATMITLEMGKPIKESRAEILKCQSLCNHYVEFSEEYLIPTYISSFATTSYVQNMPLGIIFGVMPWNFPFWQVFRFAVPSIIAGNAVLIKHAANTQECAKLIEKIFLEAGFPQGIYQNMPIDHDQASKVIAHKNIKAVSFTGSTGAGRKIAEQTGKHLKKTLLELGGNNAFVVLRDADIENSVDLAVKARFLNNGQSCIAAKRFIIERPIYQDFLDAFCFKVSNLKSGDPMFESTDLGPLARLDLAQNLNEQVKSSIDKGAKIVLGGTYDKFFHSPTVLTNVDTTMAAFREETFGPLASFSIANDKAHALFLASDSDFGLGMSIFTKDVEGLLPFISNIADGAVFINEMVKSDPRLPFGGTLNSGYGRELGRDGLLEFVNRQTIVIN